MLVTIDFIALFRAGSLLLLKNFLKVFLSNDRHQTRQGCMGDVILTALLGVACQFPSWPGGSRTLDGAWPPPPRRRSCNCRVSHSKGRKQRLESVAKK